jgi:hypothetical protein
MIEFETELPFYGSCRLSDSVDSSSLISGIFIVDVMLFEGIRQETDSKGVRFKNKEPCFIAGFFYVR